MIAPRAALAADDPPGVPPALPPPGASQPLTIAPSADQPAPPKSAWRSRYDGARKMLLDGEFKAAEVEFRALAGLADNDIDHAIALENAELAGEWARLDRAFVRRVDLGESHLTPKALDKRTGDELASLYANSVLYGILTGVWVDTVALKSSAGAALIGVPVGGIFASVAGVAVADYFDLFRYGGAQATVSGMYIGLEQAYVWLAVGMSATGKSDAGVVTTALWGGTTVGAAAGAVLGAYLPATPGRASWVGTTSLWSGVLAGSVAGAFSPRDGATTVPLVVAGLGLNAGLAGGMLTAESVSPMIWRVRLLDLGGATGYGIGAAVYGSAAKTATGPGYAGFGALGCAAGLAGMWFATGKAWDDRRETPPTRASTQVIPTVVPLDRGLAIGAAGNF